MEESYHSAERKEGTNVEVAFFKVLGNKLEHIAGERLITKMLELKDGILKPRDIAKSKYIVLSYETEFQFEVAVEQYKHALEGVAIN
ncbi:MAG: hypothetical protein PHQ66_03665 [Candidatus Nanoarchaeia archaeon]|nr:hypothetical protein [Candidatus Nanoarchaeia archaeon]MDD5357540.1 hypothetical protein [Candidatus Nanoarchaeia archaeon]MDD5588459.1 hypothetical protein [Candidatus Nanoarchaeia archaeon]